MQRWAADKFIQAGGLCWKVQGRTDPQRVVAHYLTTTTTVLRVLRSNSTLVNGESESESESKSENERDWKTKAPNIDCFMDQAIELGD